ncbi:MULTISPECIES: CoA-transferase [unclassified Mesorhizobium]|uniref:CoA-transferase n=1 Tax=unclassified Mesorhizobium TaxID=325217 RepID=UPI000FD73441|nr:MULTISPECIES: CoA-transferase [unclassified Mesorhizobium]TGR43572.1 CoA-transferase [bacterium M00.F.Ca.ET.199.01.1.1]TGU39919.1 CoA-transferase [bacterium M00.F.Ca.ET.156.01.1.1]TGV86726.1 CoA-transferase [Mesorhizobium sp. M00.F.Ca.ET.149.01.1.1]TGR27903.1 CoA-transferase [Mesorhizobium sp. M8A.F.Ca.ET.197.01.1.1]TGR32042.1 CoA-transferase [Mesorhizobium sp. M8A.F.Ca.ET.202.01.1.1]
MRNSSETSLVKPNRPRFTNIEGLAAMVGHGDSLGVGGHHFARLPIALLRAVARSGVKDLHYVCWAGGLPLELLLEANAVAKIDLCFSSLDIFGLPPRFRAAAEAGAIPVRDWTALAMIQALRAAQQNLPSMPFQLPLGSDMLARVPGASARPDPVTGTDTGSIPPLRLDTFVVHAQRADESGNVQIIGPRALDFAMAGAARKVLVTVEEIVPVGALRQDGRQNILTRNQVSAIALAPGGAHPASCLPFYVTDYPALSEAFAAKDAALADNLRMPPEGVPEPLQQAAKVSAETVLAMPGLVHGDRKASVDEIIAARIAAELDNESFASAGAVSPLANVAYRLAKATHAPDMIIATMSCGHLDIAPSPMILSLIESLDCETAAAHAGGDDTYSTYYQAGAVTHEIVGAAQVDRRGRVNTIALRKPSGGLIRLPGQGGMADVANMHRDYLLYVPRHSAQSLVEGVEIVSSARGLLTPAEREPMGYRTGKALVFTDLCIFRLDQISRELIVIETMPGTTQPQIRDATGFAVTFDADCREVPLPSSDTLAVLRNRIDPLGLRRLEFVSAKERGALIAEILAADRVMVERCIAAQQRSFTARS